MQSDLHTKGTIQETAEKEHSINEKINVNNEDSTQTDSQKDKNDQLLSAKAKRKAKYHSDLPTEISTKRLQTQLQRLQAELQRINEMLETDDLIQEDGKTKLQMISEKITVLCNQTEQYIAGRLKLDTHALFRDMCDCSHLQSKNYPLKIEVKNNISERQTQSEQNNDEVSCDIIIGGELALFNSELIRCYIQLDQRYLPLLRLIKHWTKKRKVVEAPLGNLSAYGWALAVINYLQTRLDVSLFPVLDEKDEVQKSGTGLDQFLPENVPRSALFLLPSLQSEDYITASSPELVVHEQAQGISLSFSIDRQPWTRWKELIRQKINIEKGNLIQFQKEENVAELLQGFFEHYLNLDSRIHGISVRQGQIVDRRFTCKIDDQNNIHSEKKEFKEIKQQENEEIDSTEDKEQHFFCIEDVFILSKNVGLQVLDRNVERIIQEIQRANQLIKQNAPVSELFHESDWKFITNKMMKEQKKEKRKQTSKGNEEQNESADDDSN
ncbi:MAG: hypothetical protein EZS28_007128 [Streblomastix strix]|uniref:PAP-associated domain-containing protein n=1 Tax=Streblomastix strix TaxID=222440 RepID=A0A5J4WRZ4_9EUKA|nr:MAG: hypothetical protein EZS28_007128 [Streblomastix strix]